MVLKQNIASNKKAFFNYTILEKIEAGLVLNGCEVKSLRRGDAALLDSFAKVVNNELFLFNTYIKPYEQGNRYNNSPTRDRKLLLHKNEILKLIGKLEKKGLTLVPLRLYFNKNKVKVELGLGQAKKQFDKRRSIKEKDQKRQMDRASKF